MTQRSPHQSTLKQLQLEPLVAARFAPFGDLIDRPSNVTGRHFLDSFHFASDAAKPRCWISSFQPVPGQPLTVSHLEAHPHSAQVFVALQPCRFVILVAETDPVSGLPDADSARAFLADGAGGIIYRPGVWHAGMMVLETAASFFVAQGLASDGNDEIVPLARAIAIVDQQGLLGGGQRQPEPSSLRRREK